MLEMCFFVEASRWLYGVQLPKQNKTMPNQPNFLIPQWQVIVTSKEEHLQGWYKAITNFKVDAKPLLTPDYSPRP